MVERAFALWKGKWGIFWRPLRMKPENVKLVVEVTARLHNFCIDRCLYVYSYMHVVFPHTSFLKSNRSCSTDPNDYCIHDDFFWQTIAPRNLTQPRRRVAPPPPFTDVVFADAATVASVFGHHDTHRAQRWLRSEVIRFQEGQGFTAPNPFRGPSKLRRSGIRNADVDSSGTMLMNSLGHVRA